MSTHEDTRLEQQGENYRFYGDMRFKQLTLFMAAMTAAISGIGQANIDQWWLALASLSFTAVMWIMEVRSTVNAIVIHDAIRKELPQLFPEQRKFWPFLNASFAVVLLHAAFYMFWLSRIRASCIYFFVGIVGCAALLIFSAGNYCRHKEFWFGPQ